MTACAVLVEDWRYIFSKRRHGFRRSIRAGFNAITEDRRAKRVALTTRGRGAVALLERLSWDAEAKISARLSPARLAALRADLGEALEAIREI